MKKKCSQSKICLRQDGFCMRFSVFRSKQGRPDHYGKSIAGGLEYHRNHYFLFGLFSHCDRYQFQDQQDYRQALYGGDTDYHQLHCL